MKRLLFLTLVIGCLTGCSELRVIGTAAMKEFRSDAVNAELAAYKQPDVDEEAAKADVNPVRVAKVYATPTSKQKDYKKGAWEHF